MHLTVPKIYFDYLGKKWIKYVVHYFGDNDHVVTFMYVSDTTIFVSGIREGESLVVKFD